VGSKGEEKSFPELAAAKPSEIATVAGMEICSLWMRAGVLGITLNFLGVVGKACRGLSIGFSAIPVSDTSR
jgi:hypothetical protein